MRICLIGTGYVGMALLHSWKRPDDRFIATTTTEEKLSKIEQVEKVEKGVVFKIEAETRIESLIAGCDGVVVTIAPTKGASYRETYLESAKVITRAVKLQTKKMFLLYTSSTSVYGNQKGAQVDEASQRNPLSEQSEILSEVEDIFLAAATNILDVSVLRLGGIYGPGRSLEERAKRMSQKMLRGSGQEVTNHIHLQDITSGIEFCITHRLKGVFNLVNNAHPTREQLYRSLGAKTLHWGNEAMQPVTNAVVSNAKIKECGYDFTHPEV